MAEETTAPRKPRQVSKMQPEVQAMSRISRILDTLPAKARARVGAWAADYASTPAPAPETQPSLLDNSHV